MALAAYLASRADMLASRRNGWPNRRNRQICRPRTDAIAARAGRVLGYGQPRLALILVANMGIEIDALRAGIKKAIPHALRNPAIVVAVAFRKPNGKALGLWVILSPFDRAGIEMRHLEPFPDSIRGRYRLRHGFVNYTIAKV
jgi:hypothetical protein